MTRISNMRDWDAAQAEARKAQAALQFSPALVAEAHRVLATWGLREGEYLAAHWRRDRFAPTSR